MDNGELKMPGHRSKRHLELSLIPYPLSILSC
jgi:hypothetical protein